MPISKEFSDQFFSDPIKNPNMVRVRIDSIGTTIRYKGDTIPIDGSRYVTHGFSILRDGTEIPSRFELDTSKRELLLLAYWHIDDAWYECLDSEVLQALSKTKSEVFPFSWLTNIPIDNTKLPLIALHLQP